MRFASNRRRTEIAPIRPRRRFTIYALVLGTLILLAGCTQPDRIFARSVDGEFEFLICDEYSFDQLLLIVDEDDDSETVWELSGELAVDPETVIRAGINEFPAEIEVEWAAAPIETGDRLGIYLNNLASDGGVARSRYNAFDISDLVMNEGEWSDWRGSRITDPCSAAD